MADVRAEILAASRSRTGWLDGTVQTTESQPFVSKVKSNFEEKTINQDNKLSSNACKSEAVRRLGSKVSSIATLFQSFSPHRNDCSKSSNVALVNRGGSEKNVQKTTISEQANKIDSDSEYKCFTQGENESHQKRFNSARAIFEQLGEKSKENSRLSDSSRNDSLHLEDASSSKYSMQEKDNVSSQSNRYSSQSSPDEELYSTPFCHNSFVHSAGVQFEDGRSSKTVSETSSSLHSERQNHKFLSDCTSNFSSQYSQIYEEIPPKDSSKNSRILTPKTCDHFDSNMKAKEDKNANTTNSYNECFVAHSNSNSIEADVDSSFPIYAKVVKKRSKVVSNFNHDTEAEQSSAAPANVDVVKTAGYKSAEAEKFEVPDRRSEAHQKSWENLGISSSNVWKKKASENSSDQDDNEAEGFYGISSDLRDAAGETLAEFESREHELFFVEAVLRSQHQGNLDEPFPNHKHSTSSDSKVDFMTQEEADHFLSSRYW
ncbi:uncharacterized protein LOC118188314 [Stegodyphus dumicola]|uniref:uncharacterized protein LOC118188314 n=1 Tax=Stegodyphus dumicola TaxID=202533 RepID=UPI0015ABEBF4|nr:uncharacterized protein LOC118188314 [Stegodyphus dumicola]